MHYHLCIPTDNVVPITAAHMWYGGVLNAANVDEDILDPLSTRRVYIAQYTSKSRHLARIYEEM